MQRLVLAVCLMVAIMLAIQDVNTSLKLSPSQGGGIMVSADEFAPPSLHQQQQRDIVAGAGSRKVSVLFCTS